ncbi:MAG: Ig-like domain-containing protein, partial [Solobacterium sp.]|nr:Ig-like domain-containing protein [Solobacterium sp.]
GTGYGSSAKPFVMTYIGETAQITSEMDSGDPFEEVDDTRLTYKSGNTKVVTVDSVGNVKATGKGETQITVTSKADPTLQTFVYVKVEPVTPKSFAFDRTKITDSLSLTDIYYALNGYEHYPIYELQLNTTGLPDDAEIPVTYRVYGGDGLKIYEGYGTDTNPAYYENPHIGEGYALYSGMIRYNSASIKLMATEGGVYTVTASAQGKTASCKVTVDGFDHLHIYSTVVEITKDSSLYISGKQVTGFVRIESDSYVLGADALKEVDGKTIIYLDPSTKHPVEEGIHKIGKKAYYFDSLLQIPNGNVNNWNTVYFGTSLEPEYIFVQKDGSLGTGWQGVDTDYSGEPDEMHYFDPSSYLMVKKNWVPVRSGKGVTWVNSEGKALDDYGYSLDNNGASYQDDFHKIDGNFYVFNGGYKKGARQTGWVYLKYDSGHVVLATEKTGTMKVYCDPNNNGQVATGAFWVNGKEYQGETISVGYGADTIEANVYLPGPQLKSQYGIKNVKYMWSSTYGRSFILGPDGSIVKNKLVQAYNPLVHEIAWMYAKADGSPAMEEWISVGGKSYYFDDNGIYDPEGVAASDSGLFVYSGSGSKMEVYCRPVDAKKPSSGYYYYDTEKTKLKNILLFDEFDQPILALDKNGKAAVNTVISASTKQGGEKKSYITLKDGSVYWNTYPTSGYNFLTTEVKGKLYAINPEDYSVLKDGLVPISWNDSHEVEAFGLADKNGVLKRNAFGNAQINGTTYTLYFEEDGEASWEDVPVIKGKPYMTQKVTGASGIYNGFDFYTIYKPLKEGWLTGGDMLYVNKDGSIKLGLLTKPSGKKMYVALRNGY